MKKRIIATILLAVILTSIGMTAMAACKNCGANSTYKQCKLKFSSITSEVPCTASSGCKKQNEYYQTELRCYSCNAVDRAAPHLERIKHKICADQIRCAY